MQHPRLKDGRFASTECPDCGYGTLRPDGDGWRCDGLADLERADTELIACNRAIVGGVLYAHDGTVVAPNDKVSGGGTPSA